MKKVYIEYEVMNPLTLKAKSLEFEKELIERNL